MTLTYNLCLQNCSASCMWRG